MKKMTLFKPLSITTILCLTGCTSAIDSNGYTNDPWEPMNRRVFAFNEGVDKVLLKPVSKGYEFIFPKPVRNSVSHFFGNLADIRSLGNAILQLDGKATAGIAARVIDNTVFGLGGIFDVATPMGNPKIDRDFGSTLAHYGVKSGPYMVLPFLGPSTLRDSIGMIPDAYLSPIAYVKDDKTQWGLIGLDAIQTRASLFPLEAQLAGTTVDNYATIRDTWLQHRWGTLGTPISAMQQAEIDDLFEPVTTEPSANQHETKEK